MIQENTNWSQSAAAVVIRDNKVLLARHTYGAGKGMLIIPGGYVLENELPEQAVVREYKEETGVIIRPVGIIGVRFNMKDWYICFSAEYIGGKEQSDNDENSEVLWLSISDALSRPDVPDLTKKLIASAANGGMLLKTDFTSREKHGDYSLWEFRQ